MSKSVEIKVNNYKCLIFDQDDDLAWDYTWRITTDKHRIQLNVLIK